MPFTPKYSVPNQVAQNWDGMFSEQVNGLLRLFHIISGIPGLSFSSSEEAPWRLAERLYGFH